MLNTIRDFAKGAKNPCLTTPSILRACQRTCDACEGEENYNAYLDLISFTTQAEATAGEDIDSGVSENTNEAEVSILAVEEETEVKVSAEESVFATEGLPSTVVQQIEDVLSYTDIDLLATEIRANVVKIDVYFESMWTETYNSEPSFGLPSLMAALGGNLGLYIGFSAVTFLEFGEYLMVMFAWYASRRRDPTRNGSLGEDGKGSSATMPAATKEVSGALSRPGRRGKRNRRASQAANE